jgi:cytochrome P450
MPYPFNHPAGLTLAPEYTRASKTPGPVRVRMPYGEPAWLVTRHAEARLVLADRRFSRAAAAERDSPRATPQYTAIGIVGMDPPRLTMMRNLVLKAFTTRRVEHLRPRIRELANRLIDDMISAGPPTDLVGDYALPIPSTVICELLGVPVEDRPRFRSWGDAVLSTSRLTPQEFVKATGELKDYMGGFIKLRRAEPADDLMTGLVQARDEEDRLSEPELVELCIAILFGGYEASSSQIANFAHVLLGHDDLRARLRAEPGLLDNAVEELLRYIPLASAAIFAHYATEDVEVGGVLVREGEPVLVSIGAANRDELMFTGPDALDLDRDAHAHMAFGYGLHRCLGAPLARVELQESLRALLTRLPGLRPAGEVVWKTAALFRGPESMPVAW